LYLSGKKKRPSVLGRGDRYLACRRRRLERPAQSQEESATWLVERMSAGTVDVVGCTQVHPDGVAAAEQKLVKEVINPCIDPEMLVDLVLSAQTKQGVRGDLVGCITSQRMTVVIVFRWLLLDVEGCLGAQRPVSIHVPVQSCVDGVLGNGR